jgi:hypothetical protein
MKLILLSLCWGIPIAHLVISKFNEAMKDDAPGAHSFSLDETEGREVNYPDNYLPAPGEFVPIRSRPGPMWMP